MKIRNSLILALRGLLDPLGIRLVRLAPTKVRGIDPLHDLSALIGRKPDPLVLDVGANDGETVQDFLRLFPRAHIFAFEPHAPTCAILRQKFGRLPRVNIQNIALGASRGTGELNLFSGSRMNSLLRFDDRPGNLMTKSFASTGTADVAVDTLDAFCAENNLAQIDILKTDTQGYDLEVLRGASRLLSQKRIKTVLLEVNFVPMYQGQASFPELHALLTSFGYRLVDFYNQVRTGGPTDWCDACYVAG
jgi:FkbM family methyltransferase